MKAIDELEKWIAYALLGLMALVVVSATIELAYTIILDVLTPPGFFFGIEALFELFGLFLMVLIGLELMSSIRLFLVVTPAMEAGVSTSLWSMGDLMEEALSSR